MDVEKVHSSKASVVSSIHLDDYDDGYDIEIEKYTSSIIPTTDDPNLPTLTFRVFILGTFWSVALGAINSLGVWRTVPLNIDPIICTLLSYPIGIIMSKTLPTRKFRTFGLNWSFNPGPFSLKEHVLISIMGTCGAAGAYGLSNIITQKFHLFMGNDKITFLDSLGWILATQFIGFGLAGLCRRFLVKPKAMMFPSTFGSIAMYVSLHQEDKRSGRWTMSRYKFFWIMMAIIFAYSWIPQFFAQFLQAVSLLCFFSSHVAQWIGSAQRGLGVGVLTFDWYYIVSTPQLGNVLTIPFVYVANLLLGNILFYWTLTPIFSSINAFKHPNLINLDGNEISPSSMYADDGSFYNNVCSASLFNSSGLEISATDLYDSEFNLDLASYHQQAPIYITDMFAMDYFSSFLVLSAMLSHVALWHGKQIAKQFRAALKQVDTPDDQLDIHNKLMKAYPDVPEWMYLTFLAVCTVAMCLVGVFTPFSMPVWAVLLAVFIAAATILPTGIIFAITGTQIGLNVLSEMVIGFILPGQTVTVMAFKSLCYNCQIQAFMLVADLKISHYLKIPPRAMVIAQLYATLLGSIACLTASWFVMVSPFAQSIGTGPWKANQQHIFFSAGAIWGAIAPMRFFGPDSPYFLLLSGFAIGLVCPVIPWALHKWRPDIKLWKMINFPLIFFVNGTGSLQTIYIVPIAVAWLFNYWIFNKHKLWWDRYMYVFAGAVSAGLALCVVMISVLQYFLEVIEPPAWPGNPGANGDLFDTSFC